jgi:hypothetical protein
MSNEKNKNNQKKKGLLSKFVEIEEAPKEEEVVLPKPPQVPLSQPKVEEKKSNLSEDEELLVTEGTGVNLIPQKSKGEIVVEKKKATFSISSILSLIVLVVVTLIIIFFNIFSKQQLNSAKKNLYDMESRMEVHSEMVIANDEILDRIDLYKQLQSGVFSPKDVVQYLLNLVARSGSVNIQAINIGNNLSFSLSGSTSDLNIVARLWYILGTDDDIEFVNLESVGKREDGASFTFSGEIVPNKFIEK